MVTLPCPWLVSSHHLISSSDPSAPGHGHHLLQRESEPGGVQERGGGQSRQQEGGEGHTEVGSQVPGRGLSGEQQSEPPADHSQRLPGAECLGQHPAPLGHQDGGQSRSQSESVRVSLSFLGVPGEEPD